MFNLIDADVTYGERLVGSLLKKLPKNDYFAVAEPMIQSSNGGSHPDFVLVCRHLGVAVIEIKDWKQILEATQQQIKFQKVNGVVITKENPARTARGYALKLADRFKAQQELLVKWRGRLELAFPWQEVVILTHIAQRDIQQFEQKDIFPKRIVLGKEALASPEAFVQALENLPWRFNLKEPLSPGVRDVIRSIIAPSIAIQGSDGQLIGVETVGQTRLITEPLAISDDVAELNAVSNELVKDMTVRLVRGVAGSGKTLVLLRRATYLREHFPQFRQLILTFNVDLAANLRSRVIDDQIEVTNFHKLCAAVLGDKWQTPVSPNFWIKGHASKLLGENGLTVDFVAEEIQWRKESELYSNEDYLEVARTGRGASLSRKKREVINTIFSDYLEYQQKRKHEGKTWFDWEDVPFMVLAELSYGNHELRQAYHAILLDEAQDFAPSWMKVIQALLKPTGTLFICDDPTQSLFRYFSWAQKGIPVVGRTVILRIPFRCTREVIRSAYELVLADELLHNSDEITIPNLDVDDLYSGPLPILKSCDSSDSEGAFIEQELEGFIARGTAPAQIAILCHDSEQVNRWKALRKRGVYVNTFGKMKGLEFAVVFVPHLHSSFETNRGVVDDTFISNQRRRIFTAMTRARSHLIMSYQKTLPEALTPIQPYMQCV